MVSSNITFSLRSALANAFKTNDKRRSKEEGGQERRQMVHSCSRNFQSISQMGSRATEHCLIDEREITPLAINKSVIYPC